MVEPVSAVLGAVSLANDVSETVTDYDKMMYNKLCQIRRNLESIQSYSDRERWPTIYAGRTICDFAAGVKTFDQPFVAPSSMAVTSIFITAWYNVATGAIAAANLMHVLIGGSRRFIMSAATNSQLNIGIHLNGGQSVTFEPMENTAPTARLICETLGYLEQNRLGPLRELGETP